jgi:hypothetical protein
MVKVFAKKKLSKQARDMIFKVLDSISSIAVLPFAVRGLFDESLSGDTLRIYCAAFFFAFSISFFFQALRKRNNSEPYMWQLVQMVIYLVSVILIMAIKSSDVSTPIITVMFAGMMIMTRVLSIVKNHTYRNVFFNGSCILLIIVVMIWGSFLFVCLFMLGADLVHIVSLSFSGMDLKILLKVIRKTYALDVMSGLILFIAAFSVVFPILEEDIPTYKDALWYCFAVVTTIGFGDFSATTTLGRVMSVILGIYGIVVVALVTSVVVNFYSEVQSLSDDEDE